MLLAGLMSLSLQTIYAQRITRSFRNTSMSEALTILAKSTKDYRINFMYDELEDFTVTTSIVKRTAPDAIRQIMGFYPMKMTIDGENIFVECTQKTPTKMIGRIIDNKKRMIWRMASGAVRFTILVVTVKSSSSSYIKLIR